MLDQIKIILIHTTHQGNLGATARAMKNMGLSKLYLVSPKEVPGKEAYARASGAEDILENAIVASSLDEALVNCHRVYGLSARFRKTTWPVLPLRVGAGEIIEQLKINSAEEVAILFGCEQSGLTNEELERCHYQFIIPADSLYASLNLAQAVQVVAYELRMAWLECVEKYEKIQQDQKTKQAEKQLEDSLALAQATGDEVSSYFRHLEETLIQIHFLDPNKPGFLMRHLRRLYNKSHLTKVELNILRGILKATQKLAIQGEKNIKENKRVVG